MGTEARSVGSSATRLLGGTAPSARGQASYLGDFLAPSPDMLELALAPDESLVEQAPPEILPDIELVLRIRSEWANLVVDVAEDLVRDLGKSVAEFMAVPVQ